MMGRIIVYYRFIGSFESQRSLCDAFIRLFTLNSCISPTQMVTHDYREQLEMRHISANLKQLIHLSVQIYAIFKQQAQNKDIKRD